jgi:hypothetical protein
MVNCELLIINYEFSGYPLAYAQASSELTRNNSGSVAPLPQTPALAGRELVPSGHSVVNWDYTRKRESAFDFQNWD